MRVLPLLLILATAYAANAQSYEVNEITYTNDSLVDKYFADQQSAVQGQGLMRSEYEQQTKSQVYQLQKSSDSLVATVEYRGREFSLTFDKIAANEYLYATNKKFMKIIYNNDHPTMIQGRYKSIPKPILSQEAYDTLTKKFGEKLEAYVTTLSLKEIDAKSPIHKLQVTKAFEVKGVALVVNEDVVSFGEEHRDFFMGYRKSSESMIKKTYTGSLIVIEIDGKKARIKTTSEGNTTLSFSSALEKLDDGIYRVQQHKTFWDFYVDDSETFEVTKIKYSSFLELKEEDKGAPKYNELKEKYGNRLPYNIIVQEVEEIEADKLH